ncbi:MAG TPA: DUF3362 domain-containing protein, partial [Woeseiaceae bacterium]|nr:DUF3362 domain-containing protein [Woeseiaceae bacterium]
RYHDPANWPLIREALKELHLGHLIGAGKDHLVPLHQPADSKHRSPRRKNSKEAHEKRLRRTRVLTQHTGLPPRSDH